MKVKIPWGMWDIEGNWYPNPHIALPPNEQYMRNVENGYISNIWAKKMHDKWIHGVKVNNIFKRLQAIKTIKSQPYFNGDKQ